ncbi:hypothetical protein [Curtobacterium sp. VKM Ac-1395]|uniref:hypothetical protein n=1 Tax=Curtobacterium sp. VKM Ac-1395 TaxID=2783815 RepID=UPI00188A565B|nr:hypothetical protein [Curtobacterium sp. VKM Ac-1395]MBF4592087.1 hypothetical protein [Curtobacterium sp. VKM Ac-1395]
MPDAAWSLTRAIAKRRYVNRMIAEADGSIRSNSYPLKYPTLGHQPPSTPWTIDLSDDVDHLFWFAAFDLDAKRADDLDQAAEDLGVLVRILRTAGIPHVVCRSSPTGGFHVWLPLAGIPKPAMQQLAAAARAVLPSLDHGLLCNDRTGAVRPPGSPHARGGASEVMAGGDDVDVLRTPSVTAADLLRVTEAFRHLRPAIDPAESRPSGPVDLRHQGHRALPAWAAAHMATVAGGTDPSRTGYLCLLGAAVAGWSYADVEHAARTAPGMEHYRTRNNPTGGRAPRRERESATRLERQWAKAQDRALTYRYAPQERAQRDLTELRGIVATTEAMLNAFRVSPGRWTRAEADLHDSTVLTALAWLSLHSGQRDVVAALRSIADLTGVPSTTVDRSLQRLRAAGWITRQRSADGPNAAVWRVSNQFSTADEQDGPHQEVTARPPAELFDVRASLVAELDDRIDAGRHDVFTRAGLGPTARRAYESLTTDEQNPETIATRAGLPLGRARAAIARLRRHSLAIATPIGWRRRLHDLRRHAARLLGVDGTLARRSQQYAHEREQWAWWNADVTYRAGRTPKQRTRRGPGQPVMFRTTDDRGDDTMWPAYPRTGAGWGDHDTAWRFVRRGLVQELRDVELVA